MAADLFTSLGVQLPVQVFGEFFKDLEAVFMIVVVAGHVQNSPSVFL
jgi:hypothetical protein